MPPLAELGANTEIDENSNGETIIRNTQTGTEIRLADFIDIAGPVGDSSDPVAGTSHFEGLEAGSVNTENLPDNPNFPDGAQFGGGAAFERVSRETLDSDISQVQFTGLSIDKEYRLFYLTRIGSSAELQLRLNGDGATTGNYGYWDATGTSQSGENEMLLFDISSSTYMGGIVTITTTSFGGANRDAINHRPLIGGPFNRVSDFGREGARDSTDALNSIEIIGTSDLNSNDTVLELWERDYA